ncbi:MULTISPECIES: NCS2 family permease [Halomicrobium]|uniref:Xanthine/uracil/vitamin C permease n=2 Tax=Halomicrobium mukohataei TaxID=57705 RepID=C7P0J7_HALMD|nr:MULTISPECIES: NCS2 family permease [Halomicrobium]ACV46979.1 Xanthine/uracil/vitamin C permease [Halomicrobium mukohataei DSM 12286]QCD65474.1 NCS2 family permease [Halomicrobium mukohataei]QFR20280.1 NCS2 family permease [Halomicrobium sp. ZPS1]
MGVFERFFGLDEHDTDVRTEVLAGITTFLTMSYIVVVNPAILTAFPDDGVPGGIAIDGFTPGEVFQMLAVVTIVTSAIAMFVMAFYANRPFGLAPGLGLNAFFAITVIGVLGVPWETALAAIVVEGVVFIVLTAIGAREYVIKLFPEPVKFAVGTGLGLFLAIIGLQAMGIVVDDPATLVALGSIASNPVAILSVAGLFLTFVLYAARIRGAIVLGILTTTLVGWGLTAAGVFSRGVLTPESIPQAQYNIAPLAGAFVGGFGDVEAFSFALIVFTFFFVDFFDTAGTLVGVGQAGGFLDENGDFPDIDKPLMADAVGTTIGGMLGTSTVTTYIESATGVEEGGRTGLTALVIAVLFLASLVVVPLAAAIPQYASHIALVVVAVLLMRNVVDIQWDDFAHSVPAALTIIVMPFTYSIAYGIAAGIVSYPIVKTGQGEFDDVLVGQWLLAAAFIVYFVVRTSGILTSL